MWKSYSSASHVGASSASSSLPAAIKRLVWGRYLEQVTVLQMNKQDQKCLLAWIPIHFFFLYGEETMWFSWLTKKSDRLSWPVECDPYTQKKPLRWTNFVCAWKIAFVVWYRIRDPGLPTSRHQQSVPLNRPGKSDSCQKLYLEGRAGVLLSPFLFPRLASLTILF